MGGLLAALLLTRPVRGTARRVAGALAFAVTGGLAVAAILQFWLGSLSGAYWANTGAAALTIAATSLSILGLVRRRRPAAAARGGWPVAALHRVLRRPRGHPLGRRPGRLAHDRGRALPGRRPAPAPCRHRRGVTAG
ncbi:hypothetical protein [Nonomuraea wenchangensis]|uniref:hypothetical protein n=1 Tax=Nonomuraea wenchangensis TaxID=568860 RepID=UPI0033249C3E